MTYLEQDNPAINGAVGIAAGIAGVFTGFLMGWFANEDSIAQMYCSFLGILLIIACKYGIRGCANMLVGHSELVRKHREDDERLTHKQEKSALAQVQAMKETAKSEIKYAFTSEDFNENAQVLLQKALKEAKKSKTKVSGESLVTTILKGIR